MKHLRARVNEATAVRLIQRGFFFRLHGVTTRILHCFGSSPRHPHLPRLEQVWMPYYLIKINTYSQGRETPITVSVEGHAGAFAVFQMHELLLEGEPSGCHFPPRLEPNEAERIGRRELLTAVLRRGRTLHKPEPRQTLSIEVVHYPYWVYYYERRRGLLDIKLCDAVTGEKPGARIKAAVLSAFLAAAEAQERTASEESNTSDRSD